MYLNADNVSWNTESLSDYITERHHGYVYKAYPVVFELLQQASKFQPAIKNITMLFLKAVDMLNRHMMKEEYIVFPLIKNMESGNFEDMPNEDNTLASIADFVKWMESEHEAVEESFKIIRVLTDNYTPLNYESEILVKAYDKLKEFDDDLSEHARLEEQILFRKAIKLGHNFHKMKSENNLIA